MTKFEEKRLALKAEKIEVDPSNVQGRGEQSGYFPRSKFDAKEKPAACISLCDQSNCRCVERRCGSFIFLRRDKRSMIVAFLTSADSGQKHMHTY